MERKRRIIYESNTLWNTSEGYDEIETSIYRLDQTKKAAA